MVRLVLLMQFSTSRAVVLMYWLVTQKLHNLITMAAPRVPLALLASGPYKQHDCIFPPPFPPEFASSPSFAYVSISFFSQGSVFCDRISFKAVPHWVRMRISHANASCVRILPIPYCCEFRTANIAKPIRL